MHTGSTCMYKYKSEASNCNCWQNFYRRAQRNLPTRILKENFRGGFIFFFWLEWFKNLESHSLWTVKNDCGTPTHQTKQQWTAKYVEKNRVSLKITTQNNKDVIFIGFDGQFDLKPTSKIKKKTRKLTRFVFANNCTECKFWVVTFKPKVTMCSVRLPCFYYCVKRNKKYSTMSSKMIKKWNWGHFSFPHNFKPWKQAP